MVVIRLSRFGAKKKPFYKIVVADRRYKRDGRFIERVGFYNPLARGQEVALSLDAQAYNAWLAKGAKPSDRVASLYRLHIRNKGQDLPARFEKISKIPLDVAKSIKPKQPAETENAEEVKAAEESAKQSQQESSQKSSQETTKPKQPAETESEEEVKAAEESAKQSQQESSQKSSQETTQAEQ